MTTFPRAGSEGTLIYPVFLGMRGCPGRCVYCDQDKLAGSGDFDPEQAVEGVRKFVERHRGRQQVAFTEALSPPGKSILEKGCCAR